MLLMISPCNNRPTKMASNFYEPMTSPEPGHKSNLPARLTALELEVGIVPGTTKTLVARIGEVERVSGLALQGTRLIQRIISVETRLQQQRQQKLKQHAYRNTSMPMLVQSHAQTFGGQRAGMALASPPPIPRSTRPASVHGNAPRRATSTSAV